MRIDVPAISDQPEYVFDLEPVDEPEVRRNRGAGGVVGTGNRMALYGIHVVRGEAQASAVPCPTAWDAVVYSVVTARLGFLPGRGYQFVYARVEVSLGATVRSEALRPIAFSMRPASVIDELKETTTIELTANLGLKLDVIETSLAKSSRTQSSEASVQKARVVVYGECSSEPAWDFRTTEVMPELSGDLVLAFVAATPAGVAAQGKFTVRADVRSTERGFRIPLFSKPPAPLVAGATFSLTNAR